MSGGDSGETRTSDGTAISGFRASSQSQSRILCMLWLLAAVSPAPGCVAQQGEGPAVETSAASRSLLVRDDRNDTFSAYFGDEDFDGDAVVTVAQPEFGFTAFRGPVRSLDGRTHEIDLTEPSDWLVSYNALYAADVDVRRHVMVFESGVPGLSGWLKVRGTGSPFAVAIHYQFAFDGQYDLPGFAEVPEVHIGIGNMGMASALPRQSR